MSQLTTYACPICGNTESLEVVVVTCADITQDGDNFETEIKGDHEFGESMICKEGCLSGPVKWFETDNQDDENHSFCRFKDRFIRIDKKNRSVSGVVVKPIAALFGGIELFNDSISMDLADTDCLSGVSFEALSVQYGDITLLVSGSFDDQDEFDEFIEQLEDNLL